MFHSVLGSPAFYKLNSIKTFHPVVVSPTFYKLNSNQMFHSILGSPTFCELNGIKMFNSVVGSPAFYKLNSIKMIHSSLGSPTIKLFQLILGSRTLTPRPHHCLCFWRGIDAVTSVIVRTTCNPARARLSRKWSGFIQPVGESAYVCTCHYYIVGFLLVIAIWPWVSGRPLTCTDMVRLAFYCVFFFFSLSLCILPFSLKKKKKIESRAGSFSQWICVRVHLPSRCVYWYSLIGFLHFLIFSLCVFYRVWGFGVVFFCLFVFSSINF